jgi:hypothetical protein
MCEPISLSTALTLASAGMSAAQGFMSASAQADAANAQNAAYTRNAELALAAHRDAQADRAVRTIEEQDAAAQNLFEAGRETSKRRATAAVSAGEAGVGGVSVENLLSEYDRAYGEYETATRRQLDMNTSALTRSLEGNRATTQSRINSIQRRDGPSIAATLLSIGGDALSAYDRYSYRPENKNA